MGTPVNIIVGSQVWVEDPVVAWIDGEVTKINGKNATVITTEGKTVVAEISSIYPNDTEAPPAGVDDMTKLAYLHEPGVLHNLLCRFSLNEIYTYTGNILIAVNPFRRLPHLYDSHMMEQYKGAAFGELSPHLFAVADTCYRAMMNENGSQSILVSGESGAGKTETTKMLMRYLAFMGGRSNTEGRTVEQQVLESNPVLEAFGNAKTVNNHNSSRFGKFVQIQFDKNGKISGAAIRTYLLERSRVCQVTDPERNYHCFYMLCAAPPEDVKKYKLGDPRKFRYLNQSSCYEVSNVDDAKEYLETRNAMDIVGINQDEQDAIFRVVAAILHLGNIDFVKGNEFDSSKLKDEKSLNHLRTVSELFMCDEKSLEDSLCQRVIVTPDGNITKLLDPDAASLSRDALAKTVYSRLFDWIVDKINSSIGQDSNAVSLIGVLDIYGFESFKINSFEQLCINLTNEKLQQHFNQHVFKMEQEEYTKEEINWSYVEFVDNQDVLDLIEKKPGGIIALLDEACMFLKSTHETFAQKMYQTYKGHKRFAKPKLSRTDFIVNHYAGDVTYQADYFLDKNKDYVVAEHQALLCASKCSFVANLFPPLPEESSKQSKFSSIGSQFKQQLQSLMETLSTTEPHYIRCVKPNTVLQPGKFENFNVLNQLRCGGVLEAIRISCAGYPTKRTFEEFLDRFGMLVPDVLDGSDEKKASISICDKMGLKGYQMGKTKVFLRAGQMAELDARRAEVLAKAARLIQRQIRTHLARKEFITMKKATIRVQKIWRAKLAREIYEDMRREAATIRIQKHARAHRARVYYTSLQASAIVIQSGLRAFAARNEYRYRRRAKASIKIQALSAVTNRCVTMARPIENISSIDDSKDLWKVAVRCKHLWSVTSSQNREHLELILFDSKLDMIQAIVPTYLVSKFKSHLELGCSYVMQNFKVSSNDFSFKSTDHKFKLIFCGSTSVKKVPLADIPVNHLNLIGIDAIVEGKYRTNVLYDVIGGVTEISQAQIIPDSNKSKVVFSLTDLSKHHVQCTLWGKLAVQLNEYYTTHKADGSIVLLLMNARIKEPQGNYPLNVSNVWNGTKLLINDFTIQEVKNLKEKLNNDLSTLSSSSMQMETTNSSVFSELDKFLWKAEVLSLSDIAYLQNKTTCVTVATLEKFECGQSGWYYDGCSECTKSVTLKDGKFMCYSKHISPEPVPRFKLEVLASDGKLKYKFVFWDVDCVKLIGKSALQMKLDLIQTGDFDPIEFPYELDVMLKKELAIRAVFQPNKASLSVIGFKADEVLRTRIKERFKCEEHTSKIVVSTDDTRDDMHTTSCTPTMTTSEKQSHDDPHTVSDPLSITADYDPSVANSSLTPSKRAIPETVEDLDSAQLSSTKIIRDIKLEK